MTRSTKTDCVRVLLVEDNDIDAENIHRRLSANGNAGRFELTHSLTLAGGLQHLMENKFDVVLLDLGLPDSMGIASLREVLQVNRDIPVIVSTGLANVQLALQCFREGAQDYLLKEEADPNRISQLIYFAIERKRGQLERRELHSVLGELDAAREVQQSLYPKEELEIPGYDLAGCWQPATRVGGDYYDYFSLDNGSKVIVCADVCGHGLGPAMQALQLRSVLRTLATDKSGTLKLVSRLNKIISADMPDHSFATLTIAILEPLTGKLDFVGAGQDAYLLNAAGEVERKFTPQVPPLNAIQNGEKIAWEQCTMEPGQSLVFYTDGIVEAGAANDYGVERMLEFVSDHQKLPASELTQALLDDAATFNGDTKINDDMTSVILKRDLAV